MDPESSLNGEMISLDRRDTEVETPPPPQVDPRTNHYTTMKSSVEGMLDLTLLMSNVVHLTIVDDLGSHYHYYKRLMVLLPLSITLQIIVGLLFILMEIVNVKMLKTVVKVMKNVATVFVFLTMVINIFISAFLAKSGIGWYARWAMQNQNITLYQPLNLNETGQL